MAFHLVRLSVLNFRNHGEIGVDLGPEVNCFTGPNGTGKTNLLDAVHYLALGKSYFDPVDQHNVRLGEELFVLQGTMAVGEEEDVILCSVRKGLRKVLSRNRKEYDRLADHVGRYPVVMITPYDGQIVQEGSEVRRRFLDGLIAQFDKGYLEALIRYNRALMQRNALLKRLAEQSALDRTSFEPWDEQLVIQGSSIHATRAGFMKELIPLLGEHYSGITSGPEVVALDYRSSLGEEAMDVLLKRTWDRDRAAQYTTSGIHKDDLLFTIDGNPLKRFGSQGQQKTYLIALKLAQFELTATRTGSKPVLLLDDIFDKIDPQRMRHLLRQLSGHRFGQVLITDTDANRLHAAIDGLDLDTRFFHLDHEGISREKKERTIAG
ncbi:MAG: DNA replication/repair protein RecF [Flavobacteriales bacterium]|nr:DNA replication/repair protein RecF [Flavobacteriales bacterium]MCC6939899.1 DNA replication/repair protein RecF [Flavobacteriales bacterium]